jgi:hypothetical protein
MKFRFGTFALVLGLTSFAAFLATGPIWPT